jgi:two-component system response regulator
MTDHHILLVDDSVSDLELLQRAFDVIGCRLPITTAQDGEEALNYLYARGPFQKRDPKVAPALTVLDLKMPKVGGLEVLQRIRADARLRHLAVVILTSSDEQRDKLEAQRLGVTFYFTKPPDFDGYIGLARRLQGMISHVDGR